MSNKYSIENNKWIWNSNLSIDEMYNLDDKITLQDRGRYLTDIIDKNCKLSADDIESLPKNGKYAIPYGPSSGKTTALRQFIVRKLRSSEYGLFATKLVSDVDALYYDICAQYYYIKNNLPYGLLKFTQNTKLTELKKLTEAKWIICTHERLFIEPPSLLFTIDMSGYIGGGNPVRDYIIVDEYPSSWYKSVDIYSIANSLSNLEREVEGLSGKYNSLSDYKQIYDKISEYYEDSEITNDPIKLSLVNNLPNVVNYDITKDLAKPDIKRELSKRKIAYFSYYFLDKLKEYMKIHPKDRSVNDKLYYSPIDQNLKTVYILDGTSDLLFRNSKLIKVLDPGNYTRKIKLNSANVVKCTLKRSMSSELLSDELVSIITNILDNNPNKKLLVYTWMRSNGENDETEDTNILNKIIGKVSKEHKDRLDIIYYQSGLERVTSKYIDCDMIAILGKFYIPKSVITTSNKVLQSEITHKDYTMSLILQAIFRTRARKGESIDLFLSNDFASYDMELLLSYLDIENKDSLQVKTLENYGLEFLQSNKCNYQLKEEILRYCDNGEISLLNLAGVLKQNSVDSRNLRKRLNNANINHEYDNSSKMFKIL